MTEPLISALMEKNAFANDTIITASYQSTDVFGRAFNKVGEFRIKRIVKNNDHALFDLMTLNEHNAIVRARAEQIRLVDGMEISRFAEIHDLLPDGTSKKIGRKRGRKPKTKLTM